MLLLKFNSSHRNCCSFVFERMHWTCTVLFIHVIKPCFYFVKICQTFRLLYWSMPRNSSCFGDLLHISVCRKRIAAHVVLCFESNYSFLNQSKNSVVDEKMKISSSPDWFKWLKCFLLLVHPVLLGFYDRLLCFEHCLTSPT